MINQVAQLKEERAENFTVKQMERMRKQLEKKLDKLNDQSRKDNVVTFEQLGVDSLMVDEATPSRTLRCFPKCAMWRAYPKPKASAPVICI